MFRSVLASRASEGQGGGSAQGLNRMASGIVRDQASWNRSKARAAALGGARADEPGCVRILVMTGGSSMAAMIVKGPPHWGHCSRSISNTRARWRLPHHRGRPGLPPRARPDRGAVPSLTDPSHEAPHEALDAQGLPHRRAGSYLADTDPDRALGSLQAAACTYRIALLAAGGAQGAELANPPDTRAACPRALCQRAGL